MDPTDGDYSLAVFCFALVRLWPQEMRVGWEYYETQWFDYLGGGGSGSFVLNLANCLKAHRDEKETANLIKNSRYAFWYWFLSSLCLNVFLQF